IDTWDYQWTFACWAQHGLTCLPAKNLVSNIGFGDDATHTFDAGSWMSAAKTENLDFPIRHPPFVVRNVDADAYEDKHCGIAGPKHPIVRAWNFAVLIARRRIGVREAVRKIVTKAA